MTRLCALPSGEAAASQGPMGGGGGLAAMLGQMMQSPALQQMAHSLEDRPAGRRGGAQQAAPDFGAFLQDMMPMVGQVPCSQSVLCWRMSHMRCTTDACCELCNSGCRVSACQQARPHGHSTGHPSAVPYEVQMHGLYGTSKSMVFSAVM